MEWRLFPEGEVPEFTLPRFFENHVWVPPDHQVGHKERMAMVVELLRRIRPFSSVVDIGCGDGSLLRMVRESFSDVELLGVDAGVENVAVAQASGLDVVCGDFRFVEIPSVDLVLCTEVLEHLLDPREVLSGLPGSRIVVSSPVAEDDVFHYPHHAWAWDYEGYSRLVTSSGWTVVFHVMCDASEVTFEGVTRTQKFQAVYAERIQ